MSNNFASLFHDSIPSCSVCLEPFVDPRFLQCGHSFCLRCIQQIATTLPINTPVPCPKRCHTSTTWPQNGVEGLPVNYDLISAVLQTKFTSFKSPASGENDEPIPCDIHCRPIQAYCKDCDTLLCIVCITSKHSGHNNKPIDESHEELIDRMKEVASKAQDITAGASAAIEHLESETAEIKAKIAMLQQTTVQKEVTTKTLRDAIAKLDVFNEQIVQQADSTALQKWKLKTDIEAAVTGLEEQLKFLSAGTATDSDPAAVSEGVQCELTSYEMAHPGHVVPSLYPNPYLQTSHESCKGHRSFYPC